MRPGMTGSYTLLLSLEIMLKSLITRWVPKFRRVCKAESQDQHRNFAIVGLRSCQRETWV